jgi:HSP20 family protein
MALRDLTPFAWPRRATPAQQQTGGDNPMVAFQQEMNRLFEDFFRGFPVAPFAGEGAFGAIAPRVDVSETDSEYEVTAELPGLEDKDVEVLLNDNVLTIRGEKKFEREEKRKDYHLSERSFGSFRRSVPLPAEVQEDKVEARFKNGVLTVRLPKSQQAASQAKRISVKSG